MMKSINNSVLMLTRFIAAVTLIGFFSTEFSSAQPTWPASWMYRKPVVITGTGTMLTDYQIKVELTSANFDFIKAQPNGGDIRFTDEDGILEIPYWIEEWASPVSATIWVKVPEIPADEKIIYLHYGVPRGPGFGLNPAISTSNGTNTFLFFDDFAQASIDLTKWTPVGSPSVSLVTDQGNQVASFTGPGLPDGQNRYLQSNSSFSNFILEMKVNMTVDANDNCTPAVGFRVTDNNNRYITMLRGEGLTGGGGPNGDFLLKRVEGGVETTPPAYPAYDYTANHYYDYKVAVNGTQISTWLDDIQVGSTWNDAGSPVNSGGISLTNVGGTISNPVYFDNVRVRAYAEVEPVVTVIFNEDKEWIGGSTNWNLKSGWSPLGVPSSGDNVTINPGGNPYITGSPFPVNVFTECNNLIVSSSSSLTVRPSGDLTVHGNLTINGTMQVTSSDAEDGGSLIVNGTCTGYINFLRSLREEAEYGDRHYFSSPVGNLSLSTFIASGTNSSKIAHDGTNYQIWSYRETDNSWPLLTTGNFNSGSGYNLDQTSSSDGDLLFIGTYVKTAAVTTSSPYVPGYTARTNPYDYGLGNPGSIWVAGRSWENYGGGGWNLLGNPFTSAMDAAAFINENSGKFDPWYQALYIYDGINDRYRYAASTVPGWEEPFYEEGGLFGNEVQAGQGFFVLALYNGIVFNFNSATMQKHGLPEIILLKSGGTDASWPGIKLIVASGDSERSTIVAYNDNMSTGLDPGYDVAQLSANPEVEIYTSLIQNDNDVNFARQVLPLADCEKYVIPVGIDSKNGGEVTFSASILPLNGLKFWLEDRTAGVFTEISTKSYTVTLPPETYGTGRFFIIASTNTPTAIEKPESVDAGLRIWVSNEKVIIKGEVTERAFFELFDLNGHRVLGRQLGDTALNTIDVPAGLHGIYIVRVIDGVEVTTRKIVLL